VALHLSKCPSAAADRWNDLVRKHSYSPDRSWRKILDGVAIALGFARLSIITGGRRNPLASDGPVPCWKAWPQWKIETTTCTNHQGEWRRNSDTGSPATDSIDLRTCVGIVLSYQLGVRKRRDQRFRHNGQPKGFASTQAQEQRFDFQSFSNICLLIFANAVSGSCQTQALICCRSLDC